MDAYFLRAAASALLTSQLQKIPRREAVARSGLKRASMYTCAVGSGTTWRRNPQLRTVELVQRWAAVSASLTPELFAALTVYCVHGAQWRQSTYSVDNSFFDKWKAIFCCCPLLDMRRLWTHTASNVSFLECCFIV